MRGFLNAIKTAAIFSVIFAVMLSLAPGCGKKKEEAKEGAVEKSAQAGAPGHPPVDMAAEEIAKAQHANIRTQKDVRLSEEVRKKWQDVKIEITDLTAGKSAVVDFKVGSTTKLTDDDYRLRVETFVPDYAISDNIIESRSNEPRNPAVLVELLQGNKSVIRGWVFKDFPEFNSYANDRFKLSLVAPAMEKKKAEGQARKAK